MEKVLGAELAQGPRESRPGIASADQVSFADLILILLATPVSRHLLEFHLQAEPGQDLLVDLRGREDQRAKIDRQLHKFVSKEVYLANEITHLVVHPSPGRYPSQASFRRPQNQKPWHSMSVRNQYLYVDSSA